MPEPLFEAQPFHSVPPAGAYDELDERRSWQQPRARATDPPESRAAAASVTELTVKQQAVLDCLRLAGYPLVDQEMIGRYREGMAAQGWPQQTESGLRTRRSELVTAGEVCKAGKRPLSTGRMANRWAAMPTQPNAA